MHIRIIRDAELAYADRPTTVAKLGASDEPRLVAQHAAAYLHPDGPGFVGVTSADHVDGAEVTQVVPGSPAETARLTAGDVIRSVEDRPVDGSDSFSRLVKVARRL